VRGVGSEDAVVAEPGVALELGQRGGGVWSEDAVFLAGVEAEHVEPTLELRDVVTPQHRTTDVEHPAAESEPALDERGPRLASADAVDPERAPFLEHAQLALGRGSEVPELVERQWVTEREETTLEIPDCLAPAARPEDGRIGQAMNSARSWSSAPLPFAPTI